MDEHKWVERLIVLAADKKELDVIRGHSGLINFIYRIYDEMFDFQTNSELIQVNKDAKSFEMIIMNKRLVIIFDRSTRYLDFYVNNDLSTDDDSINFGKLYEHNKIFRFTEYVETQLKLDRILLERIVTKYFKPLTEGENLPVFRFQ